MPVVWLSGGGGEALDAAADAWPVARFCDAFADASEAGWRLSGGMVRGRDIVGDIIGRTQLVISTGDEAEDFHVHFIRMQRVLISQPIPTLVADQHAHQPHVD